MKTRISTLVLMMICLGNTAISYAQKALLQRSITLQVKNVTVRNVLDIVEKQAGLVFSYSNTSIDVNKKVSMSVNNESVKNTLDVLFKGTVVYFEKGNYIILKQAEPPVPEFFIDGQVIDGASGNGLYQTSVYEQQTLISAVSNATGYFKLHIKKKLTRLRIKFSKEAYTDTLLQLDKLQKKYTLNLKLFPVNYVPVVAPINLDTLVKSEPVMKDTATSVAADSQNGVLAVVKDSGALADNDRNINIMLVIKRKLNNAWWFVHNNIDTVKKDLAVKMESNNKTELGRSLNAVHRDLKNSEKEFDRWLDSNLNKEAYNDSSKRKLKEEINRIGHSLDSIVFGVASRVKFSSADSIYYEQKMKKATDNFKNELDSLSAKLNLNPRKEEKNPSPNASDTLWNKIENRFSTTWQRIHNRNIKDTFTRVFQLGFLPPVSSNGYLSGRVTNNVSLNMLAGYANGLNGFEAAGLINVTRKDVRGAQIAGIANITGRNTEGFQAAGLWNHNLGNVKGAQVAGIYNAAHQHVKGTQISGIASVAGSMEGWQLGGIACVASKTSFGVQMSGIVNLAMGKSQSTQIAGIANYSHISKGAQIAGIVNVADTVYGLQLGLINISRKHYGIPVGLINISRYGYHQLAFDYNDRGFVEASFRTGVPKFYSIWHGGIRAKGLYNTLLLNYGYGIGSAWKVSKRNFINTDLDVSYIHPLNNNFAFNLWMRAKVNWNFYATKNVSIAGGPVFNGFIVNEAHSGYGEISPVIPARARQINDLSYTNHPFYSWIGWNISLRFF